MESVVEEPVVDVPIVTKNNQKCVTLIRHTSKSVHARAAKLHTNKGYISYIRPFKYNINFIERFIQLIN